MKIISTEKSEDACLSDQLSKKREKKEERKKKTKKSKQTIRDKTRKIFRCTTRASV
jgi:hypothetical protein